MHTFSANQCYGTACVLLFSFSALDENRVTPNEIDVVVCTHGHSDHVGNLNLFPNAKFIVSYDVSEGDLYSVHDFQGGNPYIIDG